MSNALLTPLVVFVCLLSPAAALVLVDRRQDSAACMSSNMSFPLFMEKFQRVYGGDSERELRRAIFEGRAAKVASQNCQPGSARTWMAEINKFADWTPDELTTLHGHFLDDSSSEDQFPNLISTSSTRTSGRTEELPESVDWGELQVVKSARDQGSCGSCWAFTAENTLRAHAELNDKSAASPHLFSVSQIVACTDNPNHCGGKGGCQGATAQMAFEYVLTHGLKTDEEWPYHIKSGKVSSPSTCPAELIQTDKTTRSKTVSLDDGSVVHVLDEDSSAKLGSLPVGMFAWTKFAVNKQDAMLRALTTQGPVAVSIAPGDAWYTYSKGIMTGESACSRGMVISHGNMLFGYGSEGNQKYWHLLNSWGSDWGERGTLRIGRSDDEENLCSWDNDPKAGNGCDGGPKKVWVCGTCGILHNTAVPHFSPPDLGKLKAI